ALRLFKARPVFGRARQGPFAWSANGWKSRNPSADGLRYKFVWVVIALDDFAFARHGDAALARVPPAGRHRKFAEQFFPIFFLVFFPHAPPTARDGTPIFCRGDS